MTPSSPARRSRWSTCRCCSRPAAKSASMRWSWSRRPPEIQRQRILARDNMTERKARRHPGAANARRRKAQARAISWWIPRTVSIPCGRESGTSWPRLLRCRGGDPDLRLSRRFIFDARNRSRYRNHRPRSAARRSAGRNRLCRDIQPHADRADLSPPPQSRARHAGRSLRRARPVQRIPRRPSRCLPRWSRSSWNSSAMRRW